MHLVFTGLTATECPVISCINAWKCGESVTRITSTSILSDTATSVLAVLSSLVMSTHVLCSLVYPALKPFFYSTLLDESAGLDISWSKLWVHPR